MSRVSKLSDVSKELTDELVNAALTRAGEWIDAGYSDDDARAGLLTTATLVAGSLLAAVACQATEPKAFLDGAIEKMAEQARERATIEVRINTAILDAGEALQ